MTDRKTVTKAIETAVDYAKHNIDLSDCYYGQHYGDGKFYDRPFTYYFFLAGFVAQLRYSRILEIGAHFGGSIFSMARGIEHAGLRQSAEIVTVDLRDTNSAQFRANPLVKRILGHCFDEQVVRTVSSSFTGSVDLMFIDAEHTYEFTKRCFEQYLRLVRPKIVIFDDIHYNSSMESLWQELSATHGERAIDVTTRCRQKAGFGLLISCF
jgi:predicted O-methyltransferase YrrM